MGALPFEKISREILVRKEETTNPKFGKDPSSQSIEKLLQRCVIVLDKPAGPTSHQASDYVKRILGVSKAGQSGTLDPGVSGVLPIAVGKGTRVALSLLTAGKVYVCLMHVHKEHPEKYVQAVIKSFVGKIKQLPPIKSAIKRQWRLRKIYAIDIVAIEGQDVLFTVSCQAGTYIRKLCHDMGERISGGAHMAELRRIQAGPFKEEEAVTLQDLTDAFYYYTEKGEETALRKMLKPIEEGVSHLPQIWVFDSAVQALCQGVSLKIPGISKVESEIQVDELVAVMTLKNELVMVGKCLLTSKDIVSKKSGVVMKAAQVFMSPEVYPRIA